MPSPGLTSTWGAEQWAAYVLDHLSAASVLLASGARRIDVQGKEAHVPRLLDDGTVVWVAEGQDIPSDAPDADTLLLSPKKLANVVSLSNESIGDASVSVLNAVGDAMTRAVGTAVDAKAFSSDAGTATSPPGLLQAGIPGGAGTVTVDGILDAIGVIGAAGGVANAVYLNPVDLTGVRKEVVTGGYSISDPTAPGAEAIGGARLYPTPAMTPSTALVAQADQIVVGLRQDASVSFSPDAGFTSDSTLARVVARVDFQLNDPDGVYHIRVVAGTEAKAKK
jgi:HK97 family phage major capsid protein